MWRMRKERKERKKEQGGDTHDVFSVSILTQALGVLWFLYIPRLKKKNFIAL